MKQNQQVIKNEKYSPAAAQALASMRAAIYEADCKGKNKSILAPTIGEPAPMPLTRGEARALLVTPAQSEALEELKKMCFQVAHLQRRINTVQVSFELDLPPMWLPEITERLMQIDMRLIQANWVARRLGVEPVVAKSRLSPLMLAIGSEEAKADWNKQFMPQPKTAPLAQAA